MWLKMWLKNPKTRIHTSCRSYAMFHVKHSNLYNDGSARCF